MEYKTVLFSAKNSDLKQVAPFAEHFRYRLNGMCMGCLKWGTALSDIFKRLKYFGRCMSCLKVIWVNSGN